MRRKKDKVTIKVNTSGACIIDDNIINKNIINIEALKKKALKILSVPLLIYVKKIKVYTFMRKIIKKYPRAFEYYFILHKIKKIAIIVYCKLGPGYCESAYQEALAIELRKLGFKVACEITTPIVYDTQQLSSHSDRADMIINDFIVLELKVGIKFELYEYLIQLRRYFISNPKRKIGAVICFNNKRIPSRQFPPSKIDNHQLIGFLPYLYRY